MLLVLPRSEAVADLEIAWHRNRRIPFDTRSEPRRPTRGQIRPLNPSPNCVSGLGYRIVTLAKLVKYAVIRSGRSGDRMSYDQKPENEAKSDDSHTASNDEFERRAGVQTKKESELFQSSTPSLAQRR